MQVTPRTRRTLVSQPNTPSHPAISLQPLTFPPLPALLIPTANYRQLFEDDEEALNYTLSTTKSTLSNFTRSFNEVLSELAEEKASLSEDRSNLNKKTQELGGVLAEEKKAMDEATRKKEESGRERRKVIEKITEVKAETREVQELLDKRREKKATQQAAHEAQLAKNGPELAFFEERIGLKITGKGRDRVQFKFANLDPASFGRTFAFDIDASTPTYAVPATVPASFLPPSVIAALLKELNAGRDFYEFVKGMRKAFKDEIGNER